MGKSDRIDCSFSPYHTTLETVVVPACLLRRLQDYQSVVSTDAIFEVDGHLQTDWSNQAEDTRILAFARQRFVPDIPKTPVSARNGSFLEIIAFPGGTSLAV